MTRKLYYEDCQLSRFTARVTGCMPWEAHFAVTLDATAFYPEGGGQSWDTGRLGDARVLQVFEKDGLLLHICDGPLTAGETVEGVLDWEPRFRRMQLHTGEHMVSGAIHRRFGYHNVGFHMGSSVVTMDFDGPVPAEAIPEIEDEVNRKIWQDLEVTAWVPSPEALPGVVYRTKRALDWPVRIVEIPGVDSCACCGVHVARTGQVGLVKLLSCVKFHQGVRMELVCGQSAVEFFGAVLEQSRQVSQAFSVPLLETGGAARKMNEALAAEKFRSAGLEKQVFQEIAKSYVNRENVLHVTSGLSPAGVRELAEAISAACRGYCAVFSGEDGGFSYCLACPGRDLRDLGQALNGQLSGRGGGKPGFWQGSVKASRREIEAFFRQAAQWEVDSGQLTVDSGQLTVDS